jgi:4-amino-4-deoxy-L-arabinose transferase-like glycosyltransferase
MTTRGTPRPDPLPPAARSRAPDRWFTATLILFGLTLIRDIWYFGLVTRAGELLSVPMGDSTVYLQLARELASGGNAAHTPFYWSPLYTLIVSLWSGSTSGLLIALQMLAGLLTLWLVYLGGRRLGSSRAGFVGALCLALYSPFLMEQSKLLPVTFAVFFGALGTGLAIHASSAAPAATGRARFPLLRWLVCGLSFGVSGLLMPQLLLAPVLLTLALPFMRVSRRPLAILLVLGGTVAAVLPVTIRNAIAGHDFVPVSSSAGFNTYLGWNPGATGLIGPTREMLEFSIEGRYHTNIKDQEEFQRRYAENQVGHVLRPSQISSFWLRRSLDCVVRTPGRALALLDRKFALSLTSHEFANSYCPELEHQLALPLRLAFLPWALLLGFGLAGLVLTRPRLRTLLPVYVLPAAVLVSLLLFFVNARYRLPAAPGLALLAGLGLDSAIRRRRWLMLVGITAVVALFSGLALPAAFAETIRFDDAYGWRSLNISAQRLGRPDLALDLLDRSVPVD